MTGLGPGDVARVLEEDRQYEADAIAWGIAILLRDLERRTEEGEGQRARDETLGRFGKEGDGS